MTVPPLKLDFCGFGQILSIPTINFCGRYKRSKNESFVIGYSDQKLVVLMDGNLSWSKAASAAVDASISNAGTSIVAFSGRGQGLSGTAKCFSQRGEIMINRPFRAIPNTCAISNGGEIACCNTCFSDDDSDSCKLFIFQVDAPRLIFKLDFPHSALKYARDASVWRVTGIQKTDSGFAVETEWGVHVIDDTGKQCNPLDVDEANESTLVEQNRMQGLLFIAERRLATSSVRDMPPEELSFVVRLLAKVAEGWQPREQRMKEELQHCRAIAERKLGDISFELGDKHAALGHFRTAISLDPKIGVRRVIVRMEKELDQGGSSKIE